MAQALDDVAAEHKEILESLLDSGNLRWSMQLYYILASPVQEGAHEKLENVPTRRGLETRRCFDEHYDRVDASKNVGHIPAARASKGPRC